MSYTEYEEFSPEYPLRDLSAIPATYLSPERGSGPPTKQEAGEVAEFLEGVLWNLSHPKIDAMMTEANGRTKILAMRTYVRSVIAKARNYVEPAIDQSKSTDL